MSEWYSGKLLETLAKQHLKYNSFTDIILNKQTKNISLNGRWKFITDADDKFSPENIGSLFTEKVAGEMEIPSNWQLQELDNFNGTVWFAKEFSLQSKTGQLYILKFNGVDYFASVWLNDTFLGEHEGYFQSFYFDITPFLKENNFLLVKVTSPLEEPGTVWPHRKKLIKGIFNHHDCRPGGWDLQHGQDKNTGGIWNDVQIISAPSVHISNIKLSSQIDHQNNKAVILAELFYYSNNPHAIQSELSFDILSPSGEKSENKISVAFTKGEGKIFAAIEISNPELWWSWDTGEQPLYRISFYSSEGLIEEQQLLYGLREVHLDDTQQFFLNGKRLFLRGTNLIPTQFLSELTREKISQLVQLIKQANINIVRVHAHVNRPELYEEFDKEGILVWQDFALQWTYDSSPEFAANAVSQIKDMVKLLNNYSSIAFWCCHNEPGEQIHSLDHLLKKAVLNEDSTRIIRTASNYEEHPYDGWYWGNKEHFAATHMGPLVTEFGAQALPAEESLKKMFNEDELFPPDWDKWQFHNFQPDQTFNIAKVKMGDSLSSFISNSQAYQEELLKTAIEFYRRKKNKGITGIFQFMFIDCWPSITWSVIDYFRNKKPGYDILKKYYEPLMLSINVRQDQYYPGKKILIDLYIINDLHKDFHDCSLVFFLDGKEVYSLDKINVCSDNIAFIFYEKMDIWLPKSISTGWHELSMSLFQNDSVISSNSFNFKVVENIGIKKVSDSIPKIY